MDAEVIATLQKAGIDTSPQGEIPIIQPQLDGDRLKPLGSLVTVEAGDVVATVELKPIPKLFAGARVPPSFRSGPTPEYELFFATIEQTAVACCAVTRPEYDRELERVYAQLRRRPLSSDANPLFTYLRAAVQLYMSLHDVSQAEFEAVVQRLSLSAGHFATSITSTSYVENVGQHFFR